MNRLLNLALGLIVAVIVAFAALYGTYHIWHFSSAIIDGARTLEPSVYVPLVVTVLTATAGLIATLYTNSRNRRREIEAAFRERKIEIYLEFLKALEGVWMSAKGDLGVAPQPERDLTITLFKVRTKAVLWASPGVLEALSQFTKMDEQRPIQGMLVLEKLQTEMRKDLGLSNSGLGNNFFTKMMLSDPGELDRLLQA